MNEKEIKIQLELVLQKYFSNPKILIVPHMKAKDIKGWDSLNHIAIMMKIESMFKIRFKTNEISNLKNIDDLISLIRDKLT